MVRAAGFEPLLGSSSTFLKTASGPHEYSAFFTFGRNAKRKIDAVLRKENCPELSGNALPANSPAVSGW
jgi:hypothetical protein